MDNAIYNTTIYNIPLPIHRLYLFIGSIALCFNCLAVYLITTRISTKLDTNVTLFNQIHMALLSVWVCFFSQNYVADRVRTNSVLSETTLRAVYIGLFCGTFFGVGAHLFVRSQVIALIGIWKRFPTVVFVILLVSHYFLFVVGTVVVFTVYVHYHEGTTYRQPLMEIYYGVITVIGATEVVLLIILIRSIVAVLAKDRSNISLLTTHKNAMNAINAQTLTLLLCFGLPILLDKFRLIVLSKDSTSYKVLYYFNYMFANNVCIPNTIVMIVVTKRYRSVLEEWIISFRKSFSSKILRKRTVEQDFHRRSQVSFSTTQV